MNEKLKKCAAEFFLNEKLDWNVTDWIISWGQSHKTFLAKIYQLFFVSQIFP
jgi:hypothetical protein